MRALGKCELCLSYYKSRESFILYFVHTHSLLTLMRGVEEEVETF